MDIQNPYEWLRIVGLLARSGPSRSVVARRAVVISIARAVELFSTPTRRTTPPAFARGLLGRVTQCALSSDDEHEHDSHVVMTPTNALTRCDRSVLDRLA